MVISAPLIFPPALPPPPPPMNARFACRQCPRPGLGIFFYLPSDSHQLQPTS